MKTKFLGIACVAALWIVGCSNDPGPIVLTDTGPSGTDAGTDAPMTVDAPMGDPCADLTDCSACGTQNLCGMCCYDANPAAATALENLLVTNCACVDAAAPCNADCAADLCAGGAPGTACVDCINAIANAGTDACVQTTVNACAADATCQPLMTCFMGC